MPVTAMLPDGGSGVDSGKNGFDGVSSTDRDNNDHNADGDRRCRRRPRPLQAAMAVAMMTMAGERGDETTVRQLQGEDEAMEMRRQSDMAPAQAS